MFSIYADGQSIYDPSVKTFYLFNPKVKLEFGKSGSLEFSIPPTNAYYNSLKQLKTVVSVNLDGDEIFRGRVFSIEQDFNNFKKIYCEGDLSYLVDSVQKAEAYNGTTRALFNKIIANHNARVEAYKQFTVGEVTIEDRPIVLSGKTEENPNVGNIDYKQIALNSIVDEWNNTFDCIQSWIIDYCGGYLRTRRVGNITYIDFLERYNATSVQHITFGENLLDFNGEANPEELFTVLVPIGDENLTISSVNGGSDEIVNTNAVAQYGRIIRTHVFSNVNNANTLLENGQRYLAENSSIPITYTVKAIDMHLVDDNVHAIHVGDRVMLDSAPHGITEYLTCTEIEYDLANPENNSYTFGNPKQTLTQRYKEDQRKNNDISSAATAGAGAAGAGAAAAAEEAQKKVDDGLKDFYDAYLNLDPEHAKGSLGALYKDYENTKLVLSKQVGIDFDATEGNINLFSLTERVDENTGKVESALAQTSSFTGVVDGQLTAMQQMIAKVDADSVKQATWEVFANETETAIRGKADSIEIETLRGLIGGTSETVDDMKNTLTKTVGIKWDADQGSMDIFTLAKTVNEQGKKISENSTSIKSISDDTKAQISLVAKHADANGNKIAKIEATATSQGSKLKLMADEIKLKATKTEISGVTQKVDAMKNTLKTKVGIDLDANTGQINIKSLAEKVDANGEAIKTNSAAIQTVANDNESRISAVAKSVGSNGEKIASLELIADDHGSAIEGFAEQLKLKADKAELGGIKTLEDEIDGMKSIITKQVGINWDTGKGKLDLFSMSNVVDDVNKKVTDATTNITTLTNKYAAMNKLQAEYNGKVTTLIQTASAQGTAILAKADQVTLDTAITTITGRLKAAEADIGTLKAKDITTEQLAAKIAAIQKLGVSNLTASSITSPSISISDSDGTYPVASRGFVDSRVNSIGKEGSTLGIHYHEVSENANGTVTFGKPTSSPQSFNIKATKTYKEGVAAAAAAANVSSITIERDENSTDYYSEAQKTISVRIIAEAFGDNNKSLKKQSKTILIDGNKAYTHGLRVGAANQQQAITEAVDAVTVSSLKVDSMTYNPSTHNTAIVLSADLTNNKTYTRPGTVIISGADAFNAGKASVDIIEIGKETVGGTTEMYNNDHTTTVYIKAAANNNNTLSGTVKTGTKAYDKGYDTGYNKGTADGTKGVTVSVDRQSGKSDYYNKTAHTTTIYTTGKASNGKSVNVPFTTDTAAYDAGKSDGIDAGAKGVTISSLTRRTDVENEVYNSSTHKTTIYTVATASNGATKTQSFTTNTAAYNDGVAVGENGVTIDSITGTVVGNSFSANNKTLKYNITAKTSKGKTKIETLTLDVAQAVNGITVADITHSSTDDLAKHLISAEIKAVASNEKTKTVTWNIDATNHYNKGRDDYKPNDIVFSQAISSNGQYFTITATAKNAAGTTYVETCNTTSAAYTNGKNDWKPTSIDISYSFVSSDPASDNYKYYNATAKAYNKNGELLYTQTKKSSASIYNRGYDAGKPTSIDIGYSFVSSDPTSDDYKYYNATAKAYNKNGELLYTQTKKSSASIYNRGYNKGRDDYKPNDIAFSQKISDTGQFFTITATAKNAAGTTYVETYNTTSTAYTNGKKDYNPDRIDITYVKASDHSSSDDYKKYEITAKAYNKANELLYTSTAKTDTGMFNRGASQLPDSIYYDTSASGAGYEYAAYGTTVSSGGSAYAYYWVPVRATSPNGSDSKLQWLTISADAAYNAGSSAGYAQGKQDYDGSGWQSGYDTGMGAYYPRGVREERRAGQNFYIVSTNAGEFMFSA